MPELGSPKQPTPPTCEIRVGVAQTARVPRPVFTDYDAYRSVNRSPKMPIYQTPPPAPRRVTPVPHSRRAPNSTSPGKLELQMLKQITKRGGMLLDGRQQAREHPQTSGAGRISIFGILARRPGQGRGYHNHHEDRKTSRSTAIGL